jgi:hypothetical protein
MNEGMAKLVGFVSVVVATGLFLYKIHEALGIWLYITPIILVGGFFLILQIAQNRTEANISKGVTEGEPMKVNLRTEQLGQRKHRLHIDVKMCASDWEAIKQSGLGNLSLFEHERVTKLDNFYSVGHLLRVRHVDFDHMQDLEHAKDQFIEGMHSLRSRIESQKNLKATPIQERTESYDI